MITELRAVHDSRKSFYGKAIIEDGVKLYSYGTLVASVEPGQRPKVYNLQSRTTARHVREFLLQNGYSDQPKTFLV